MVTEVTDIFPGSEGMAWHQLPADGHPVEFLGRFLRSVDTDDGERTRWAELRLYRIIDTNLAHSAALPATDENRDMYGKQMWLLYTIGHSLVYHAADGCTRGLRLPAGEFPARAREEDLDNLEPCPVCRPPDWDSADPGTELRLEVTWYSYTPCQSAEKVIRSLWREPRCVNCRHKPHKGTTCRHAGPSGTCTCADYAEAPRQLSQPGHNLIEEVRRVDPLIDTAAGQANRL